MIDRKEQRFAIQIGAAVEINDSGRVVHATTINVSGCGVLLEFEEPVHFLVGDLVSCDFILAQQTLNPLPCWGSGKIVRVDGRCIAVEFEAGWYEGAIAEAKKASGGEPIIQQLNETSRL